jgi:hypothetical protein
MKYLILTILAITAIMLPTTGAMAATEFWTGTAAVEITDPVSISCSGGDGNWDALKKEWAVSIVGGGTKTLKMTATNSSTTAYTVIPSVSPPSSTDGKVTAVWSQATGKYIAAGATWEYTLTVTSTADAALGTYGFTLGFSK